jgi:isocitrate dehydrogenase (NAD+)
MPPTVTLIRGDGIGPEVVDAALRVLHSAGAEIEWDERVAGLAAIEQGKPALPEDTLESIRRTKVALKGPLTTPVGSGFRSVNVAIRKECDLFANVRPAKTMVTGLRFEDVDLVVVRENTEGLYVGVEHYIDTRKSAAESITIVTRDASARVIRYAFELARTRPARHLTLVHKANILKFTSGLFLQVGREMAGEYPDVTFDERIIDNMAMQLVVDPLQFDTIVTTNMFGDILSDLCAGLVGGLGMAPAANIGEEIAVYEAIHGSAPDIAGKGVANPTALLLAAAMLCERIGQVDAGRRVREAVERVLGDGRVRTRDLGGDATTELFADAVLEAQDQREGMRPLEEVPSAIHKG